MAPTNPVLNIWLWVGRWAYRHRVWSGTITAVLTILGGTWLGSSPRLHAGPIDWKFSPPWLGLVLIAAGLLLAAATLDWERRDDSAEREAEIRDRFFERDLAPLLEAAASVTGKPKPEREAASERAVAAASHALSDAFTDVAGVRVVVYKISDDGSRMVGTKAGRNQRAGDHVRGTPRGDRAFAMLNDMTVPYEVVEDLDDPKYADWVDTSEGYKTFIIAPIRSETEGYGLLTVDAEKAGSLAPRHASSVAMFAAALAVFFAEATRGSMRPTGYDEDTTTKEE